MIAKQIVDTLVDFIANDVQSSESAYSGCALAQIN